VHPGGMPRRASACVANSTPGDSLHASKEMLTFARRLHEALSSRRVDHAVNLFGESAVFIHPMLHEGPPGYDVFNRSIQVRGKNAIRQLLHALLPLLPDGADSTLVNVVGG